MRVSQELYEKLKNLTEGELDEHGRELCNPIPVAVPAGLKRPLSLTEQIQRVLRRDLSYQAQKQGHETFEEADDFDVDDGFDGPPINTRYEMLEEEYLNPVSPPPPNGGETVKKTKEVKDGQQADGGDSEENLPDNPTGTKKTGGQDQ